MKPCAIMIHVSDVSLGLDWYRKVFPTTVCFFHETCNLAVLQLGSFVIEIVQADEKVFSGKAGTVMYWSVSNFESTLNRFLSLGSKLYRGPMKIENEKKMCQIEDPFGNLIGLIG